MSPRTAGRYLTSAFRPRLTAVSEDTGTTILDLSATLGVDYLIIALRKPSAMAKIASRQCRHERRQQLPDSIQARHFG